MLYVRMRRVMSGVLTGAVASGLVAGLLSGVATPAHAIDPDGVHSVSADAPGPQVVSPQVVNGRLGDPVEFRALVAIADRANYVESGLYDAQVCGGTAVTATVIITAAHCVIKSGRRLSASQLVVAHTPSGALTDPQAQVAMVSRIAVNPDYDDRTQAGDIAVLHLREPITGIEPMLAALPSENARLTVGGAPAVVAGWGATTPTGRNFPDRFRVGRLTVFPESACGGGRNYTVDGVTFFGYTRDDVNPEFMVCAQGVRDALIVDSCIGDSGGPLIAGTEDDRRLVGVVSWGPRRCASTHSGVYARVSAYTAFLRSQGVPFAPTPTDAPSPPTIVSTAITPTTARITVAPGELGAPPRSYRVTARDANGMTRTCTMNAPGSTGANATCTLTDLATARRYTVTAVARVGSMVSEPSQPTTVRPADRPLRPRITSVSTSRGGTAVFDVARLRANGSPFTQRIVVCLAEDPRRDLPRRSAPITSAGTATVTGLRAATTYSCRARVANAVGAQRSAAVTLRAR